MKIADLHNDLLSYLNEDRCRSAYDLASTSSISQFKEGGVVLQVFVIFCKTENGCQKKAEEQFLLFKEFPIKYREFAQEITPLLAIENASCFCGEEEDLEVGLKRLDTWRLSISPVYISLTWNEENRFGGGNATNVGLKPDGLTLLKWLHKKNIAIDFSHSSDLLAEGILDAIDKYHLDLKVLASHSNFREKANVARNLPTFLAKEIIQRKGIIGLNLVRSFLGDGGIEDILHHIEYGLTLGAQDQLGFGADFFLASDFPTLVHLMPVFHPEYNHAGCYPHLFKILKKILNEKQRQKIAYENVETFLKTQLQLTF